MIWGHFELFARFGAETFAATLGEAVRAYLGSHQVEWIDSEKETPKRTKAKVQTNARRADNSLNLSRISFSPTYLRVPDES